MTPPPADSDSPTRHSAVDQIADRYLEQSAALDPLLATQVGIPGYDHLLPDLSPAGFAAVAELARTTLRSAAAAGAEDGADAIDAVTVAALEERLGLELELYDSGETERTLNNLASPVQAVRDIFDLMKTDTAEQWDTVAERLSHVPAALAGLRETLGGARDRGHVAARRQVLAVAEQCAAFSKEGGFFDDFVAGARVDGRPVEGQLAGALRRGADAANAGYAELETFLRTELLPAAPEADAVGIDRYRLASRTFLGTAVDLAETYQWGQDELARIEAEMAQTAGRIVEGGDVAAAVAALDADAGTRIAGTGPFRDWMQQQADRAITELAGTHFDIPDPVRTIECKIAPTHTGGIYYTPPTDDFSRPGAMWWSVPEGVDEFSTWRELTTVFHEGVPGHHLQCAQTVYRANLLNRWRRLGCWVSGHGEGWALYAERLMAELGYLDDPAPRLGMLDSQAFRATRVVIDIGVHCGFEAPAEVGGGAWDYDKAWTFLTAHTRQGEPTLRFELDRYLGWPGQAPSYKVGERFWLQLRDEVAQREGDAFDLVGFHRRALDVGSVGLDVLRQALLT